jgi:hypothetical protein
LGPRRRRLQRCQKHHSAFLSAECDRTSTCAASFAPFTNRSDLGFLFLQGQLRGMYFASGECSPLTKVEGLYPTAVLRRFNQMKTPQETPRRSPEAWRPTSAAMRWQDKYRVLLK